MLFKGGWRRKSFNDTLVSFYFTLIKLHQYKFRFTLQIIMALFSVLEHVLLLTFIFREHRIDNKNKIPLLEISYLA